MCPDRGFWCGQEEEGLGCRAGMNPAWWHAEPRSLSLKPREEICPYCKCPPAPQLSLPGAESPVHFLLQLVEKRCSALKKRQGLQEPPNPGKPHAGRDDCAPQRGAGSQIVSSDHQGHSATNAEKLEHKPSLPGNQWSPSLGDPQSTPASFADGSHSQGLGSRRPVGLRGASPARGAHESVAINSKGTDDLPSMSYLLSSQSQLVPWRLLQSLDPHSGLSQRKGLTPDPLPSPKSKTPTVIRGLAPGIKLPSQGPDSKVSEVSPALELACPSQPRKRKCESLRPRKRKRKKRY